MKAVRIHAPGDPKQLVYEDISKPSPKIGEALMQVHAVGITPSELLWSSYAEEHLPMVIGHDFSGIIEEVGAEVDQVKIGDSVCGLADFWRDGAAAEYVVVKASDLAHKPGSVSYIQAAAVPTSALTGWQAMFDHAGLLWTRSSPTKGIVFRLTFLQSQIHAHKDCLIRNECR
jgi:NADPH:quinone reductase-like Zn-dependent oxidoreductase